MLRSPRSPEAPKPEAPKIDPAEGLVFMSRIGLQLSVRFYAAKLKVKLSDQVKELAKLTPDEEAWRDNWRGAPVYIITSLQDAMDAMQIAEGPI